MRALPGAAIPEPDWADYLTIRDQWWRDQAACAGDDVYAEWFFPGKNDDLSPRLAKEVCARCPVQAECLDDAVASADGWAVRGGLTAYERTGMRVKGRST